MQARREPGRPSPDGCLVHTALQHGGNLNLEPVKLSDVQAGRIGEYLLAVYAMLTSNGELVPFHVEADDDHRDIGVAAKGKSAFASLQANACFSLGASGFVQSNGRYFGGSIPKDPSWVCVVARVLDLAPAGRWPAPAPDAALVAGDVGAPDVGDQRELLAELVDHRLFHHGRTEDQFQPPPPHTRSLSGSAEFARADMFRPKLPWASMPETPEQLYARVAAGLRMPPVHEWDSFPFDGEMRPRALRPPVDREVPRHGAGGAGCRPCAAPDSDYIWTSERRRLSTTLPPTALPLILLRHPRAHFGEPADLPDELASELGLLQARVERAVPSIPGVRRVHVCRC